MLDVNANYVKEDGILLYSTCTLNKKENEKQIQSFLTKHQEFEFLEEKIDLSSILEYVEIKETANYNLEGIDYDIRILDDPNEVRKRSIM